MNRVHAVPVVLPLCFNTEFTFDNSGGWYKWASWANFMQPECIKSDQLGAKNGRISQKHNKDNKQIKNEDLSGTVEQVGKINMNSFIEGSNDSAKSTSCLKGHV